MDKVSEGKSRYTSDTAPRLWMMAPPAGELECRISSSPTSPSSPGRARVRVPLRQGNIHACRPEQVLDRAARLLQKGPQPRTRKERAPSQSLWPPPGHPGGAARPRSLGDDGRSSTGVGLGRVWAPQDRHQGGRQSSALSRHTQLLHSSPARSIQRDTTAGGGADAETGSPPGLGGCPPAALSPPMGEDRELQMLLRETNNGHLGGSYILDTGRGTQVVPDKPLPWTPRHWPAGQGPRCQTLIPLR